jgi:magnesium transporter
MAEPRFFSITPTGPLERCPTLEAALAARRQGGYIWLDYVDPSREQLSALAAPLGLHPFSIEDCLDEQQLPKTNNFPDNTFLLFNVFAYAGHVLTATEVDFFLGRDFLVTVSGLGGADCGFHEHLDETIRQDFETARRGPDFLLHTVLDLAVDSKAAAIEGLEDDIDGAEEAMLADTGAFQLADLMRLRRSLLTLRKGLFHEREILGRICRRDCPFITEAAIYHWRDVYDHLTKFFELVEMNRDIVTSLTEMYLSLVNNQMARVANETNLSVKRLTLITTIFMPLTLLTGVGGMSEWTMMTGPENWRVAYPAFLVAMLVIGVINYYILRTSGSLVKPLRHRNR